MAGEKILIVDDDLAHALLCQRLLQHAGFLAEAVNVTADALERLNTFSYDLLITDIRMPDMDGFELMSLAAKSNPNLATLLITGFGTVENAVQALKFGADGLLLKPLTEVDELVKTVASVLEKRQNKLDAIRLNLLHPLFTVSEKLFTETTPDILSSIEADDIRAQTQSAVTGIYRDDGSQVHWTFLAGTNLTQTHLPDGQARTERLLADISKSEKVVVFHPEDEVLQNIRGWLIENRYRDAVCVTAKRVRNTYFFYAIRSWDQPEWTSPDLELFVIYARLAAVALENAYLYDELKGFIKQLEESQRSLIMAEKMAALGRLMASLAHEVNNPLQSVQNCLHLAAREDLPESQRQEFIQLASQEVKRVSTLAQTAMEYYRPKRLIRQRVDLVKLIITVLDLVEPQQKNHQILIHRELPDHPVIIGIIQDNIQQVILNLLINAMDALLTQPADREIWIELHEMESDIEIAIEDNGPGLPAGVEERLFEPFFSTKEDGSGLGLSISYELIVDVHGGELGFVPPVRGKGARVQILLPRKD